MARVAFCSSEYPCTCHNVLCAPFCWMTLGCCKGMCLETYDQTNRRDIRKMTKQQQTQTAATVAGATAAAPQPQVMVYSGPGPVQGIPESVQP